MQIYFIYLILLLIMIIILYKGIELSFKYAPIKIKYISISILIAMVLKYITLGVMLIVKNIKYLYFLKPIYFINLVAVPIAALVIIYILARSDKIKIDFIFIFIPIILLAYVLMLYKLPCYTVLNSNFGYNMYLGNPIIVLGIYIIINTLLLFIVLLLLDNKYANKTGLILALCSALITVVEVLLMLNMIKILPSLIIGDLAWMLTLNYALSRLKK